MLIKSENTDIGKAFYPVAVEESLGWGEGGVVQPGQDPIPQLLLLPIRQNLFLKLTLKTIPKGYFVQSFWMKSTQWS